MIQSIQRAVEIMDVMSSESRKFSVIELATATGMHPSTIHRFLSSLLECGLVAKDESAKLYYLGPALIPLGQRAAEQIDLRTIAKPFMEKLSAQTGEDTYLVVRSNYRGIVIEHTLGNQTLKYVSLPGNEAALHSGAIRKTLLAYQTPDFIDDYIARRLERYTDNTTVDEETLRIDLSRIRANGYAITHGEYIDSVYGFGAPIFDSQNTAIAAVGIIAPDIRINEENKYDLAIKVKMCAVEVSAHMGCSLPVFP